MPKDAFRISVNGWFHGSPPEFPERVNINPPKFYFPGHIDVSLFFINNFPARTFLLYFFQEHLIYAWINPLFLEPSTQENIQKEFQEKSEIQLSEFLQNKKYKELSESLQNTDLPWKFLGPLYKRHYEVSKM